jgi:membrane protein required for colicin V production
MVLALFLAYGAYSGYRTGILLVLVNTLALVAAVVIGFRFLNYAEIFVSEHFQVGKFALPFAAFAGLALVAYFSLKWFGKMASRIIKMTLFGPADQILGALSGLFKMAFLLSSLAFGLDYLGLEVSNYQGKNLYIFPLLVKLGPACFKILGPLLPFLKKMGTP